jgi:hypothetical protein
MRIVFAASVVWVAVHASADCQGAPPQVSRTTPAHHAAEVDPATTTITVEFDQDMDTRSFSGVRFGTGFPALTGAPRWKDTRTCVFNVKIEAGRIYTLGINGGDHVGFRSPTGESAKAFVLTFRTKGGNAPPVESLPPEKNLEAIRQLREAIDQRYSYRDLRKVDWPKQFAAHEASLRGAWTSDEFVGGVCQLLGAAQDEHVSVRNGGVQIGTWNSKSVANFSLPTLKKVVPNWKQINPIVATGKFDGGIGYLLISGWNREARAGGIEALKELADCKALVLDVRPNMGGDETDAGQIAGRFLTEARVYARHRFRDASKPGGFTETQGRTLTPVPPGMRFTGRVAVLIGPLNISSNESFILMMKQAPSVKLIGQRTYGSSGNPKPVNLANGVTVNLPTWQAFFPDGSLLEGKGIDPDILVPTRPADFRDRDPVLEKALEWLRGGEVQK